MRGGVPEVVADRVRRLARAVVEEAEATREAQATRQEALEIVCWRSW